MSNLLHPFVVPAHSSLSPQLASAIAPARDGGTLGDRTPHIAHPRDASLGIFPSPCPGTLVRPPTADWLQIRPFAARRSLAHQHEGRRDPHYPLLRSAGNLGGLVGILAARHGELPQIPPHPDEETCHLNLCCRYALLPFAVDVALPVALLEGSGRLVVLDDLAALVAVVGRPAPRSGGSPPDT